MSVLADRPTDLEGQPADPPDPGQPSPPPVRPGRPGWAVALGALGGAWLLPALTHLVGADLLLLLVIWAGTASLLRSGRTLLDRLALSGALLTGAVALLGVLFSVWPWGLHPVPVAGLTLTLLVVTSLVSGRRPSLPRRFELADGILLAATAAVALLTFRPLMHASAAQRFTPFTLGEDLSRHFAMFDGIRTFGGYLAFHQAEVAPRLQDGFATYPQGSHLAAALIDNFVRSDASASTGVSAFDHYLWLYCGSFVLTIVAVMWAMRWVAGPMLRGWAYLAPAALGSSYLFFGDGMTSVLMGFAAQIAASGLFALLIAVTARPLRDPREQVVVVASLLVAISTTYYLYLFALAPAMAYWLWRYRRQLWEHRWWTLAAVLVGAPGVLFAPLANLTQAYSVGQLAGVGGFQRGNRQLLLPLLVLTVAALLTRYGRRSPAWHMAGAWIVSTGVTAATVTGYLTYKSNSNGYYPEKFLQQFMIAVLVGAASIPMLLRTPGAARPGRGDGWWGRALPAVAGATAVALALMAFSRPIHRPAQGYPASGLSWGRAWVAEGLGHPEQGRALYRILTDHPAPPGTITGVVINKTDEQYQNALNHTPQSEQVSPRSVFTSYSLTLYYSVLSRNYGDAWEVWIWAYKADYTPQNVIDKAVEQRERHPGFVLRMITDDPTVRDAVQSAQRQRPDLGLQLVWLDRNPTL